MCQQGDRADRAIKQNRQFFPIYHGLGIHFGEGHTEIRIDLLFHSHH